MGLTVYADRTLPNGLPISGFYVNIKNITIQKELSEEVKYNVSCDYNLYATKNARIENKETLAEFKIYLTISSLDDIHGKVYDAIKKLFDTTEDDTEVVVLPKSETTPVEETSNTTPAEETSNTAPVEETSNTAPVEETSNTTPAEETSNTAPTEETSNIAPTEETSNTTPAEESTTAESNTTPESTTV